MNKNDIDKNYVSPYDQFIAEFDATHDKSASQLKEIKKFQRIFALRDNADEASVKTELWEEF